MALPRMMYGDPIEVAEKLETIRETKRVRAILNHWARWRRNNRLGASVDWQKTTIIGKLIEGMPGTICPKCRGAKTRFGVECPTCGGTGRIRLEMADANKCNPAFISPTRKITHNELMCATDRIICDLRRDELLPRCYLVLWAEYVSHPYQTQENRAKSMGIQSSYYRNILHKAHRAVAEKLRAKGFTQNSF